jgi:hypothetical protein
LRSRKAASKSEQVALPRSLFFVIGNSQSYAAATIARTRAPEMSYSAASSRTVTFPERIRRTIAALRRADSGNSFFRAQRREQHGAALKICEGGRLKSRPHIAH